MGSINWFEGMDIVTVEALSPFVNWMGKQCTASLYLQWFGVVVQVWRSVERGSFMGESRVVEAMALASLLCDAAAQAGFGRALVVFGQLRWRLEAAF